MENTGITVAVLPEYQLKLSFPNGSEAVVDMKNRIRAVRFGRLAEPELFASCRLEGNEVVWGQGADRIRASVNELLDSMQMD